MKRVEKENGERVCVWMWMDGCGCVDEESREREWKERECVNGWMFKE